MNVQLKNLSDQVLVITGAFSGIGLVTARQAAAEGARRTRRPHPGFEPGHRLLHCSKRL